MIDRLRQIWLAASLLLAATQSASADWEYYTGTNPDGGVRVTASAEENGFHISLQCDAGDDPEVFHLTFVAADFPYLDNTDDAETQLIFKFDGTGKDFVADGWSDVWYFAPDRAWTGLIYFEAGVLDSFGGASTMRVMNMNSQEVTRFSMKGSRKAEQAMRAMCHQGMTVEQWATSQQPVPATEAAEQPDAPRIVALSPLYMPMPLLTSSEFQRVGNWDIARFASASPPIVLARTRDGGSELTLKCEAGKPDTLYGWVKISGVTAEHGLELDFDIRLATGVSFYAYGVFNPQDDGGWFGNIDMRAPDFRAFGLANSLRVGAVGDESILDIAMHGSEAVFHAMRRVCNALGITTSDPDPEDCGSRNYDQSINACNRYITAEIDPAKLALAHGIRAWAKERQGDRRGALADQDMTVRLNPDEARYYGIRAENRLELGDRQGAIEDLRMAHRLVPDDPLTEQRLVELADTTETAPAELEELPDFRLDDEPPPLPAPME